MNLISIIAIIYFSVGLGFGFLIIHLFNKNFGEANLLIVMLCYLTVIGWPLGLPTLLLGLICGTKKNKKD